MRVTVNVPSVVRIEGSLEMVFRFSSLDRLDTSQLFTWAFGVYRVFDTCVRCSKRIFIKSVFWIARAIAPIY